MGIYSGREPLWLRRERLYATSSSNFDNFHNFHNFPRYLNEVTDDYESDSYFAARAGVAGRRAGGEIA
jgi:hypothetical protein